MSYDLYDFDYLFSWDDLPTNEVSMPGVLTQEQLYLLWADSTLESADFWSY